MPCGSWWKSLKECPTRCLVEFEHDVQHCVKSLCMSAKSLMDLRTLWASHFRTSQFNEIVWPALVGEYCTPDCLQSKCVYVEDLRKPVVVCLDDGQCMRSDLRCLCKPDRFFVKWDAADELPHFRDMWHAAHELAAKYVRDANADLRAADFESRKLTGTNTWVPTVSDIELGPAPVPHPENELANAET